ncbi:hypothetical protein RIF29_38684 [Crotalaria pallida]|uniref:DUF4283 domain-containing protein n=1 Tax=Crotalaria pallida TaxID=3830 RepID=A0AAN9HP66_CROPI
MKSKQLFLSDVEAAGVVVLEEEVDEVEVEGLSLCLVGKLWTNQHFNVHAFKSTMVAAWKLKKEVVIQQMEKNVFCFPFSSSRDMEFVLKNCPWNFDRHMLVLKCISRDEQPSVINLDKSPFWVRIHDLPMKCNKSS